VTVAGLIVSIAVGAALLALWSFVRWPAAAPRTIARAILHSILALGTLQLAATGLGLAANTSEQAAALALIALVVPALTYAFLSALWVLNLFAGTLKGVG
jgi:hypothetical protein